MRKPPSVRPADRPLVTTYRTISDLGSVELREQCDSMMAGFLLGDRSSGATGTRRSLSTAMRCHLRHGRDAIVALTLAAALPDSTQDVLDRSLFHVLRTSIDFHRTRCSAGAHSPQEGAHEHGP